MEEYKGYVDKMGLYPSDKKKLLALPFYMAKRKENPEPRPGQDDLFALFKDLTGNSWHDFNTVEMDTETKITEFDYENYLNPDLLKRVDTSSKEFKKAIRILNFHSKTAFELH